MLTVALRSGPAQITAICIVATCQNLKSTPAPIGGFARLGSCLGSITHREREQAGNTHCRLCPRAAGGPGGAAGRPIARFCLPIPQQLTGCAAAPGCTEIEFTASGSNLR
jgi:hypothetical protein